MNFVLATFNDFYSTNGQLFTILGFVTIGVLAILGFILFPLLFIKRKYPKDIVKMESDIDGYLPLENELDKACSKVSLDNNKITFEFLNDVKDVVLLIAYVQNGKKTDYVNYHVELKNKENSVEITALSDEFEIYLTKVNRKSVNKSIRNTASITGLIVTSLIQTICLAVTIIFFALVYSTNLRMYASEYMYAYIMATLSLVVGIVNYIANYVVVMFGYYKGE